jgi:alpha-L-fucosidase
LPARFWIPASGFWLPPLAICSARPDQLIRKAIQIKAFSATGLPRRARARRVNTDGRGLFFAAKGRKERKGFNRERRERRRVCCLICLLLAGLANGVQAQTAPDLKFGMFLHWGLLTFTGDPYQAGRTKDYGFIAPEKFAPSGEDAAQWVKVAKDNGMTFAVMVAKHEDGFCLWPSAVTDYSIAHSPCKMDVLGNFIAACEAEGITPGLFYTPIDVHNEGSFRVRGPIGPPVFNLMKREVVELLKRYPDVRILAIDDARKFSPEQFQELLQAAKQANPQCLFFGEQKSPLCAGELACAPMVRTWFWHTNAVMAPMQLILGRYNNARSNNVPFTLNFSPDPSGHIPDNQIAMMQRVKELIASGAQTITPAPAAAKPDAATRLKELKSMLDQGLINQDEYNKKRQEILDSM